MAKTIILTEEQNKIIMEQMLHEAQGDAIFGGKLYLTLQQIEKLRKIVDKKFYDPILQEKFDEWSNVNFDKESKEYADWSKQVEYFRNDYLAGLLYSFYAKINPKQSEDDKKKWDEKMSSGKPNYLEIINKPEQIPGRGRPLHELILDQNWLNVLIKNGETMEKILDNIRNNIYNEGNTGYRCLYGMIEIIYQNKCIWNDFFFNPLFNVFLKFMRNNISKAISSEISTGLKYKALIPMDHYKEMTDYMRNQSNAKPELFYDPNWKNMGYTKAEEDRNRQYLINNPVLTADDYD